MVSRGGVRPPSRGQEACIAMIYCAQSSQMRWGGGNGAGGAQSVNVGSIVTPLPTSSTCSALAGNDLTSGLRVRPLTDRCHYLEY